MKVVILAGGFGTRISEESHLKPKPMIEIGNEPILIHLMKHYSSYGFNDFIICLGYKSYIVKEYFNNLKLHHSDVTFDFSSNSKEVLFNSKAYPWKVTLVDTGLNTMTGGRIKRIQSFISEPNFMITYGDGLSDVDLNSLVDFHMQQNKIMTITAVNPDGRFGLLGIQDNLIKTFREKPKTNEGWINGGFMVASTKLFDYLKSDNTVLEKEPLENLANDSQLTAYKHYGFWHPMDTLRDKVTLETYYNEKRYLWRK